MATSSPYQMSKMPNAPEASSAFPIQGLIDPLGGCDDPKLTTPAWPPAPASDNIDWPTGFKPFELEEASPFGTFGGFGNDPFYSQADPSKPSLSNDLAQVDSWAWELGSEMGSLAPSAWSASTKRSSATSLSTVGQDVPGFPGLVEGQRLQCVKPGSVPPSGGTVMVGLRKQIPQGYWDQVEIMLVAGTEQVKLKPIGIKKGKKTLH
jgi:hypothetical protein